MPGEAARAGGCSHQSSIRLEVNLRQLRRQARCLEEEAMVVFPTRNEVAWTKVSRTKRRSCSRDIREIKLSRRTQVGYTGDSRMTPLALLKRAS